MLVSVEMNGQIEWQAHRTSHLVWSLPGQRCLGAWRTFCTWTGQSITALVAWRKEEWRKEMANILPSEVSNDLCSTKHWRCFEGNLEETTERWGRARMGLFLALQCHLEQKLKLNWNWQSALKRMCVTTLGTKFLSSSGAILAVLVLRHSHIYKNWFLKQSASHSIHTLIILYR